MREGVVSEGVRERGSEGGREGGMEGGYLFSVELRLLVIACLCEDDGEDSVRPAARLVHIRSGHCPANRKHTVYLLPESSTRHPHSLPPAKELHLPPGQKGGGGGRHRRISTLTCHFFI